MPTMRGSRLAAGADALVVSNHGGRQLDGATSTIAALPRVVDAVAGRCEVLMDGGINSGQDVLKATGAGRARLPYRQELSLWACGAGRSRRVAGARHPPPRTRNLDGVDRVSTTFATSTARAGALNPERRSASACVLSLEPTQPAAVSSPSTSEIRAIATSDAGRFSSETLRDLRRPQPASRAARRAPRCRRA